MALVGNRTAAKLTPERHRAIIEAITQGAWIATAARLGGVSARTVRNWVIAGRGDDALPEERAFAEAYDHALASAEHSLLLNVRTAANTDAKHAEWLLMKRFKRWKDQKQIDLTSGGKPLPAPTTQVAVAVTVTPVVDVRRMALEDLQQLHAVGLKYAAEPSSSEPADGPTSEGRAPLALTAGNNAGTPT